MTDDRLPDLLPGNALADPDEARRYVTRYTHALTERLHQTVALLRQERAERLGDLPLGRTDVAPLLRQLASFADLMTLLAKNAREVARTATDIAGEEVIAAGETRVVTPDGMGKEVVVRITSPRSRKCDRVAMWAALAAIRTTEHGRQVAAADAHLTADQVEAFNEVYRLAYRQAQEDIASVSTPTGLDNAVSVTRVDALSRALQAHGQDDLAGLLDRTLRWVDEDEKTTITVEDPKARRRG